MSNNFQKQKKVKQNNKFSSSQNNKISKRANSQKKYINSPDIITQISNPNLYSNNLYTNNINYLNMNLLHHQALTPINRRNKLYEEEYLLPQKSLKFEGKKTLVLDIDETLVHSSFFPFEKNDLILNVNFDGIFYNIYVLVRPWAEQFIKDISKIFEVITFTASIPAYASPLLDILDKGKNIQHRLYREHCTFINGVFIKDLKRLNRNLKDVIIVDNSPLAFAFDSENGLPIISWFDDPVDKELINIQPLLEFLANTKDVRKYIKKFVKNNIINYEIANKIIKETKIKNNFENNNKIDNNKIENNNKIEINNINANNNINRNNNINKNENINKSDKKNENNNKIYKINENDNNKNINNTNILENNNKNEKNNNKNNNINENSNKKENNNNKAININENSNKKKDNNNNKIINDKGNTNNICIIAKDTNKDNIINNEKNYENNIINNDIKNNKIKTRLYNNFIIKNELKSPTSINNNNNNNKKTNITNLNDTNNENKSYNLKIELPINNNKDIQTKRKNMRNNKSSKNSVKNINKKNNIFRLGIKINESNNIVPINNNFSHQFKNIKNIENDYKINDNIIMPIIFPSSSTTSKNNNYHIQYNNLKNINDKSNDNNIFKNKNNNNKNNNIKVQSLSLKDTLEDKHKSVKQFKYVNLIDKFQDNNNRLKSSSLKILNNNNIDSSGENTHRSSKYKLKNNKNNVNNKNHLRLSSKPKISTIINRGFALNNAVNRNKINDIFTQALRSKSTGNFIKLKSAQVKTPKNKINNVIGNNIKWFNEEENKIYFKNNNTNNKNDLLPYTGYTQKNIIKANNN